MRKVYTVLGLLWQNERLILFSAQRSAIMSVTNVVRMIEENDVRFVDLRFSDTKGKQHHFTVPASVVLEDPEE